MTIERILASGYIIFIGTIGSIETGMSIRLHLLHFKDRDIRWKQAIEFIRYRLAIQFFLEIEMSNHQASMNTGIGTSCSYYLYLFPQKGRKRLHQRFLYTGTIRLNLPTVIIGTVVC